MRVSSKVALSTGLLTVILIAVLGYNITQVRRLAETQRELAEIELLATTRALEQQRLMPQFESAALKYLVTRDPLYARKVAELRASFETQLEALGALDLSDRLRRETDELRRLWEGFLWSEFVVESRADGALGPELGPGLGTGLGTGLEPELGSGLGPEDEALLGVAVRNEIEGIRAQLGRVTEATRETFESKARAALAVSARARTASWIVVVVTLACAVPILLITFWSIREPLRRLEEGTRSVARGIYSYPRLDDSRHDEFSDIASSFNEMVARLGELDQMKRDFLSHVSHELRTPLVTMDETNRLLLEELPGPLTDKQRKFLELNLEGSRRLGDMISKLLDLARLEERAVLFEHQDHDLVGLATRVADGFHARARELGMTIEGEAAARPVLADCDADRVTQLVSNLVDNALKHSPAQGTVVIRLLPPGELAAPGARAGDRPHARAAVGIQVVDNGPGVPAAEKRRIFEKFHQVGRPRRGGVGLGLAICSQIVDAHGGAIWVEDNRAGGSVFCVTLPAAADQRAAQTG